METVAKQIERLIKEKESELAWCGLGGGSVLQGEINGLRDALKIVYAKYAEEMAENAPSDLNSGPSTEEIEAHNLMGGN